MSEMFLALALIAQLAAFAQHPTTFRPPRLMWYWLVWAGLETAIWLHSADRRSGFGEIRHLLLTAALFVTLPALSRTSDKVRVWRGIFAAATLGSGVLILEFLARTVRYRHDLAAGGDPAFYLRTGGLLHHWMVYGTVEIMVFAAILEFRASYPEERHWVLPMLSVQSLAILLSLTRSLWVAAVVVVGLHIVRRRSNRSWKRILPLAVAALILVAAAPVRHRIAETFQPDYSSNTERLQMWQVGWQMIRQHLVLGVGPGKIDSLYTSFLAQGEPIPAFHGHLHNNALQLCAQFGVLVLCAAAIFTLVLIQNLPRAGRRAADRDSRFLFRSGLQGMIGFLAMGTMDYTYGHSLGIILFMFAAVSPLMSGQGSAHRFGMPQPFSPSAQPSSSHKFALNLPEA